MFRKVTYRFCKKGKGVVVLILFVSLLCGISGCAKEQTETSASGKDNSNNISQTETLMGDSSNSDSTSQTETQLSDSDDFDSIDQTETQPSNGGDTDSIGQTETSASDNNDSQTNSESRFDIETVRKNIVIKGQTIEIPVALGDLPDGWSYQLYDEKDVYLADYLFLATMYYNDEEMYIATLENYDPKKVEESIIFNFTIYTSDCSIDGFMPLESTKQELIEKYGEPVKITSRGSYSYGLVNGEDKMGGRINDHSLCVTFAEDDTIAKISITYADLTKEY